MRFTGRKIGVVREKVGHKDDIEGMRRRIHVDTKQETN